MNKDKTLLIVGSITLITFFLFIIAGVWVSSWYLSAKLISTGFLMLMCGTAVWSGLGVFWGVIEAVMSMPQ